MKTFNTEFSYIEVWFYGQNSKIKILTCGRYKVKKIYITFLIN